MKTINNIIHVHQLTEFDLIHSIPGELFFGTGNFITPVSAYKLFVIVNQRK